MLDISEASPYAVSVQFAHDILECLSYYDLDELQKLIDENDSGVPIGQSFPQPDGFQYCPPAEFNNWTVHFVAISDTGFSCEFEMPFAGSEFRPMMARFTMRRHGDVLRVHFDAVVPS
ncbi:hypothetical protein FHS27_006492 [Rhodopirellula rubra]|uniref:Uncharacterized protein n=1 Tax=Aporhodopirellula rubra TaxID=980271 RepID=A0A7W5E5L2_9BACT|nr:hypothetical protein [Aporhodopirellula rubra]MBB3210644.1 hypothetical protein [Aporhodopirellula rubra]